VGEGDGAIAQARLQLESVTGDIEVTRVHGG
jgi:hypothetical protein